MTKTKAKARRYFAGANTKHGFYNLFGEINQTNRAGMLYILKGGPGTGKSTLMKKVGKAFEGRFDVEYFFCSSDPESLDGVRIPAVNMAIVDGTAPHVTETVIPGVREKIIDLGVFIGDSVRQNENEISYLMRQKKLFFQQVYLHIKNASNLFECNDLIYASLYNDAGREGEKIAKKVCSKLGIHKLGKASRIRKTESLSETEQLSRKEPFSVATATEKSKLQASKPASRGRNNGSSRKLFLSAIGGKDFTDLTIFNNYGNIIELNHDQYLSRLVLTEIVKTVASLGMSTECYCEVLAPETYSGVFIPKLDVLIRRKPETELLIKDKRLEGAVCYNNAATLDAAAAAARALADAKNTHKEIEEYYIPSMDFSGNDRLTQDIITEIEQRIADLPSA